MRPNYNKNTGDSYSASEWGQLKSKCNEPGLNTALTTAKKFDDEYYPPPQTISANETWTIDATNAGNGNGFAEIITASGTPTLTLTGFTIRKRLISTDTGQTVTLVDGHEYTIISIKRGSFYDLYVNDNEGATPIQTLSTPTLALTAQNGSIDYAISNEDAAATGGILTYDTNSDFSTEIPVPGYVFATKTGTISGLVNDTPYYARLINSASGYNNSLPGSDTATPSTGGVLFIDTFDGTTIDTTTKWDLTNPDPTYIQFTQNDELSIYSAGGLSVSGINNYMVSQISFDLSSTKVLRFHINPSIPDYQSSWFIGFFNSLTDRAVVLSGADGDGDMRILAKEDGIDVKLIESISVVNEVKIVITPTDTTWYHYTAGWVELATVAHSWTNSLSVGMGQGNSVSVAELPTTIIDNIYVTNFDYTDLYPI